MVSVLSLALRRGTRYEWGSYQTIAVNRLVLGILGLAFFHWYETMPWVKEPTLPEAVFTRRTPAAALIIAFISFILMFWCIYFLPVYFQAVLSNT